MQYAQNAFLPPTPAPQQTHLTRPSFQSKPISKHVAKPLDKEPGAVKNDGRDDSLASFVTLLNQAADRRDDVSSEPFQVLNLRLSAEHGQILEEYNASLPLGGDNLLLSKSILDLVAFLKSDLEKKGVDVDALSGEVGDMLGEMGLDWDLKAVEAMLSRLRNKYVTVLESDSPRNIDIRVLVSDYLKFGLEASLTSDVDVDIDLDENHSPEEDLNEAEQPAGGLQMNDYVFPDVLSAMDVQNAADQSQPLTVSKFHSYLKPETSYNEATAGTLAVSGVKPADTQTDKNAFVETTPLHSKAKPRNEILGDSRSDKIDGENFGHTENNSRKDKDVPVRSVHQGPVNVNSDKADNEVDDLKGRPNTNFTEHRTTFEQFFEHVTARRDDSGAGPASGLELRGSSFSQGDALRDGLDNVVRFIRVSGEQRAHLIIDPPALGRVSVELVSGATGLEASIKVSSEQVRQLIQDHLVQLRHSLEQQGVQLTHFSVDVQQDDRHRNQGWENTRRRRQGGMLGTGEEDSVDDETLFQVDLDQGLLYWIA